MRWLLVVVMVGLLAAACCTAEKVTLPLEKISRRLDTNTRKRVDDISIVNDHIQFIITIAIGTPAQTFKLQLDTGSVLTAVNIQGCTECDQNSPNPHYNPSASTTSSLVLCSSSACSAKTCYKGGTATGCGFGIEYYSGSIEGEIYQDTLTMGNYSGTIGFGVIYKSSANFEQPSADGIMGLGYNNSEDTCVPNCVPPAFDSLRASNPGLTDMFAFYVTSTGGYLTLGGYDESLVVGPVYYTAVIDQSLYYVKLNSISVASTTISSGAFSPVIDSGTSEILLPASIYTAFKKYIQSNYANLPGITGSESIFDGECYGAEGYADVVKKLPTLTFVFSGVQLTIPASSWMQTETDPKTSDVLYCLFVSASNDNSGILGLPVFVGNTIIFDRVNNQIGFAVSSTTAGTSVDTAPSTTGPIYSTTTTSSSSSSSSSSPAPPTHSLTHILTFAAVFIPAMLHFL